MIVNRTLIRLKKKEVFLILQMKIVDFLKRSGFIFPPLFKEWMNGEALISFGDEWNTKG